MSELRIFVGFDSREAVAFHVCVNSLIRHASRPLSITPLALNTLPYWESHKDGSNAFIYSRFLVPYLCGWTGWALYLDGDMVVKDDVVKLFERTDPYCDVMVAKHDYKTKHPVKYMGAKNDDYPRKNWSSVILWNCGNYPNRVLTPEYIQAQTGDTLHRFKWLDDKRIGSLPLEWNWLVGEYEHNEQAKLLHYTVGIPAFREYHDCDHAKDWHSEFRRSITPCE